MSTQLRNLALVGHAASGKTTLAESMLFVAGATKRRGTIAEGNTTSDYHPDEIARKHSINTSLLSFHSGGFKVNILDTPGYSDFTGEVRSALHVADTALICMNAVGGVEIGTDQAWDFCAHDENSIIFVVNKLDSPEAHWDDLVEEMKNHFGHEVVVVQFPYITGVGFCKIIDVMKMKMLNFKTDGSGSYSEEDIPADVKLKADQLHKELVEIVAESDDTLMEEFFSNDGTITEEHFSGGIHESLAHRKLFPILCASAEQNIGVKRVLEFITANAPAPEDHIADLHGFHPETSKDVSLNDAPKDATTLFVFKTLSEAHLGDLSFFRVFHGELHHGQDLMNVSNGKAERVMQCFTMLGKNRTEVQHVGLGDIAAAVKLKDTHTNNTLSSKSFPVVLKPIVFPEPVITNSVRAKNKGDEEKIALGLHSLHEEDPSFVIRQDGELVQTLIEGQGELHLDIAIKRLKERYKIDVDIVEPKIPYRETIRGNAETRYRHKKQSGGSGQFGEVALKVAPQPRGGGYAFEDAIVGGAISHRFIPAVDKGIHELLLHGPLAGCPVVDVKVTLFDGKEHAVDSNENAFKTAGRIAFKEAFLQAKPTLLEPVYDVEVTVPEDHMGDVLGDISSRRGKVQGMETKGTFEQVKAKIPLAELYHYATRLRSLTQGKGSHRQRFSHYEEAPKDFADKVISAYSIHRSGEEE